MGTRAYLGRCGDINMWVEDWTSAAACRQAQPDQLFVRGAEQNRAKQLCAGCPVRTECLAEALDNQIEWGVWGGMTERERRALLRRRPNASWRAVLEAARSQGTPATAPAPVNV
jgi:WhiB family redox-sensing transcriptional regulator